MSNKKLKEKILKEEVRKNNKRVRDRNYRFRKLSPAKKRVSIARDVIKQLNAEKFTAQTGTYFELRTQFEVKDKDLSFAISRSESCNVCALGALFSSCVLKNNHFKLENASCSTYKYHCTDEEKNVLYKTDITKYLKPYFSEHQLYMIENAFECSSLNRKLKNDISNKCKKFGRMFLDDRDRMIAIMKNIIDNNGTFIPGVSERWIIAVTATLTASP